MCIAGPTTSIIGKRNIGKSINSQNTSGNTFSRTNRTGRYDLATSEFVAFAEKMKLNSPESLEFCLRNSLSSGMMMKNQETIAIPSNAKRMPTIGSKGITRSRNCNESQH